MLVTVLDNAKAHKNVNFNQTLKTAFNTYTQLNVKITNLIFVSENVSEKGNLSIIKGSVIY